MVWNKISIKKKVKDFWPQPTHSLVLSPKKVMGALPKFVILLSIVISPNIVIFP